MSNGRSALGELHPARGSGRAALVSDFDGTMTEHDFFKLAIDQLLPANTEDYWASYRTGAITGDLNFETHH
jgi:2-hydroxy-3-keto-5-methylthiopentenyl-1-phosphate phosphatase